MEDIRNHLGLTPEWFRRRYIESLGDVQYGIRLNTNGACPFLNAAGKCTVYSIRPAQCRTYPFWPEVVGHKKGWQEEAKRCEGINTGDVMPIERIEKNLLDSAE